MWVTAWWMEISMEMVAVMMMVMMWAVVIVREVVLLLLLGSELGDHLFECNLSMMNEVQREDGVREEFRCQ